MSEEPDKGAPEAQGVPAIEPEAPKEAAIGVSLEPDIPPPQSVPIPRDVRPPAIIPTAVVSDVTPDRGPVTGGTRVVLTGRHLHRESIVRVDDVIAQTVGAREPHELRVLAPPRDGAGPVDVSIQNPGSALTVLRHAFTYEPIPAPRIDSVAPNLAAAAGGTEITISGQNFVSQSSVLVAGRPIADVAFIDATTLELVAPAGAAGKLCDVVVQNPDGKRAEIRRAFKYA